MFTGYSSTSIALALPADGCLYAFDVRMLPLLSPPAGGKCTHPVLLTTDQQGSWRHGPGASVDL